jgi:hypothetical protein
VSLVGDHVLVLRVQVVALSLSWHFFGRHLLSEHLDFIDHHQLELLGKRSQLAGVSDIVLEVVNLDFVVARDHIRLVHINVGSLLISGKDDLVMDV